MHAAENAVHDCMDMLGVVGHYSACSRNMNSAGLDAALPYCPGSDLQYKKCCIGEANDRDAQALDEQPVMHWTCRLVSEVKAAQAEANDNAAVLKPLRPLFDKLGMMDDFAALQGLFRPIMHLLLLIWTHSKHYNTATRFVSLMRLICNDLVEQARRAAPGGRCTADSAACSAAEPSAWLAQL